MIGAVAGVEASAARAAKKDLRAMAHIGSKQRYSVAAAIICNAIIAAGLGIALLLLSVTLEERGASGLMIGLSPP